MSTDPADGPAAQTAFIVANTAVSAPPHVPEIRLRLASEAHDLWHRTEEELQAIGLPPPFWAFAWAGGQGLARHILDHPGLVHGRRILDLATGSGLVAIAAAMAGASVVTANDIDPFSKHAVSLNALLNSVVLAFDASDLVHAACAESIACGFDVITAGDVFYDREMAVRIEPFLRGLAARGVMVLVGDPGRSYFPTTGMMVLGEYRVPVTRVLEDGEIKHTRVYRVAP